MCRNGVPIGLRRIQGVLEKIGLGNIEFNEVDPITTMKLPVGLPRVIHTNRIFVILGLVFD